MSTLMGLENDLNEIVKAIAAALKVDVEIVDTDLIKVAVVGRLEYLKGTKLEKTGRAYRKSIETGENFIIEATGEDELCTGCEWYGNCICMMTIYSPIKGENEVVGVISLTAYDEEQTKILKDNLGANLIFVEKMANLVYSKVIAHRMFKDMVIMNDKLNQVMNSIDRSIIATDNEGRVTHINQTAMEKLKTSCQEHIIGKNIENIFPSLQYKSILISSDDNISKQEICNLINSNSDKYIVDIRKILYKNEIQGLVLSFDNYDNAKSRAYTLVNGDIPISTDDIIGQSKAMVNLKNMAIRVSQSNSTVMLIGETGTGKEVFSRAIHHHSPRRDKPFVTINCSAIPDSLIESELFGYEKGAFTGANKLGKPGKFEIANGGTIFLDEIEAMPIYMQPKILRVIQEKEVVRIGSNENIPIDVRIITATNVDLEKAIIKGEFRSDLYHRLYVIPVNIPPLRERKEDILLLANYFMDRYAKALGRNIKGIDKDVENLLLNYKWPGNVRELNNAIEFAINLEDSEYITVESIPSNIKEFKENKENEDLNMEELSLIEMEACYIKRALDKYGWDEKGKVISAKKLGISRATIYNKIKNLHLENN